MNLLRKVALAWMFAWLPVSGVMASTMPFCAQSLGGALQAPEAAAQPGAGHCHEGSPDGTAGQTQLPGEHCDLCHLAGALAAPSLPFVPNAGPGVAPVDTTQHAFRSWVPDPPHHPPLFSPA